MYSLLTILQNDKIYTSIIYILFKNFKYLLDDNVYYKCHYITLS